jgi:uncharacterized protein YndB with AHSA1/START domain
VSPQHDLGTIERSGERSTLRIVRHLNAPPSAVWRLLTEPGELSGWLHATVEIEPRSGGAISLHFHNTPTTVRGEIRRFEAPSTLEYTWQRDGEAPSIVLFELEPDQSGSGTQLRVTHSRLSDAETSETGAGWHYHLELLANQLAGESTEWQWSRFEELHTQYGSTAT